MTTESVSESAPCALSVDATFNSPPSAPARAANSSWNEKPNSSVQKPPMYPRRSSPPSAPRAADSTSGCQGLPVYRSSSMSSSQQSITTPVVIGEPLVGGFPTDMDVDDDNLALLDAHDTPSEKVDANFFNGEPGHRIRAPTPRATRLARASRGRACLCPQWHSPHSSRLVIHRFRGRLRRRRRGMNDTCVHACIRHWCKPS